MIRIVHLSEIVGTEPRVVPELFSPALEPGTGATLANTVSQLLRRIGFETFVYLSEVRAEGIDSNVVIVTNMPRPWIARYGRSNNLESDPCVESCLQRAAPFLWDSKRTHGPNGDAFRTEATRYGLASGIALPIRSPGGERAMFCVSSPESTLPEKEDLQLAIGQTYIFASYFHERLFPKLRRQTGPRDIARSQITKREREVLELAAHGRSSKRIAYELGISESTANYHIASIKRKLSARTRTQAIAQAVEAGLIR
jgi:LuxR family quorum sensing-dependent transcriptional regulator